MRRAIGAAFALLLGACGGDDLVAVTAGVYDLDPIEMGRVEWQRALQERSADLEAMDLDRRRAAVEALRAAAMARASEFGLRLTLRPDESFEAVWRRGSTSRTQTGRWRREAEVVLLSTLEDEGVAFAEAARVEARVDGDRLRFEGEGLPAPFVLQRR